MSAFSPFAAAFPGTVSVRPESVTALIRDILACLAEQGFTRMAIANAHLDPAHIGSIRGAMAEAPLQVIFPDVTRRALAERLTAEFQSGACHAGSYESSLVMAEDPEAVDDALRNQLPEVDISLVDVIRAGQKNFIEAGGTQAYFGRPAEASAEEGR